MTISRWMIARYGDEGAINLRLESEIPAVSGACYSPLTLADLQPIVEELGGFIVGPQRGIGVDDLYDESIQKPEAKP